MKLYLLSLVAATLLLSTLGCSKKDDAAPAPAAAATGSFKRDGVIITGTARATLGAVHQNGQTIDKLFITITEAPLAQGDPRYVMLEFQKTAGTYQLYAIIYRQGTNYNFASSYPAGSSVATAKETSPSSFSGTFSGTGSLNITSAPSTLSDGVFTAAPL